MIRTSAKNDYGRGTVVILPGNSLHFLCTFNWQPIERQMTDLSADKVAKGNEDFIMGIPTNALLRVVVVVW